MRDEERLQDILEYGRAAQRILSDAHGLLDDEVSRLAVERALFLVGEAASHVGAPIREAIDQPWQDIIGLRHVLAHRYEHVRPDRLVEIVQMWLPDLLDAVEVHVG